LTGYTVAGLPREPANFYTAFAVLTDPEAGHEHVVGVTHDEVLRVFAANMEKVRALLLDVVGALPPTDADCSCRHALDGLTLPFQLP
jgi:5'-methylthioadenosine phosphorylase